MSLTMTVQATGASVAATKRDARRTALIDAIGIVKVYPTVSGEPVLALGDAGGRASGAAERTRSPPSVPYNNVAVKWTEEHSHDVLAHVVD